MVKLLHFLKVMITVLYIVFISLTCVKIANTLSFVKIDVEVVYIIIYILSGCLILFLLNKRSILLLESKEPYLIMSTIIGLDENSTPFYQLILNRLKSYYKVLIKDLFFNGLQLVIFLIIFFFIDNILPKTTDNKIESYKSLSESFNNESITDIGQILNKDFIENEIKKIAKIKDLVTKNSKSEQIIREIYNLKFIDNSEKNRLAEKILNNKEQDIFKDLQTYLHKMKSSGVYSKEASSVLEEIEKDLLNQANVPEKKNNKRFKISAEYLQKWYGYEDVLKKYFKEVK